MKPPPFAYTRPQTLAEALTILADRGDDASVLAGGQSLMPLLNMRLARPEVLIDINRIAELDYVDRRTTEGVDTFCVGSLVRAARLERDAGVKRGLPVVSEALGHVGHPQIRNRTTVGGNIAHADPSSELPGVLAALDGKVVLSSLRGRREVSWEEFFVSVFMTAREPDELVTEIQLPVEPAWSFRFSEFARRHGDFPIVALTVGTKVSEGRLEGLRLSVTGVGECVVRLRQTEAVAQGELFDERLVVRIAQSASAEVSPGSDAAGTAEYRRYLVGTLLQRVLTNQIDGRAA